MLKRSGASLLSVKGCFDGANWDSVENQIILSFLEKYWDRIQDLNIQFTGLDGRFESDDWSKILCKPSPFLRCFDLRVSSPDLNDLLITHGDFNATLFSGHAPSLQEFRKGSIIAFSPAPWLAQLRILELNFEKQSTVPLNIAHMLNGLNGMDLLEHLVLQIGKCANNSSERICRVRFPSLRRLDITSLDFEHSVLLLQNIVRRRGCSLLLNASGSYHNGKDPYRRGRNRNASPSTSEKTSFKILVPLIANHSNKYFNVGGIRRPRSLELRFFNQFFQCAAYVEPWTFTPFDIPGYGYSSPKYLDRAKKPRSPDPDFKVEIMAIGSSIKRLLSPIISSIPLSALGRITTFKLFIAVGYMTDQKTDSTAFLQLMESLTSVETLATTANSLAELIYIGIGRSALPSLRNLTLMDSLIKYRETFVHPIILHFLRSRTEAGLPIKVLTIDEDPRDQGGIGLQFLEVMSGLKVVWRGDERMCEYVCGTGNPGVLDFSSTIGHKRQLLK